MNFLWTHNSQLQNSPKFPIWKICSSWRAGPNRRKCLTIFWGHMVFFTKAPLVLTYSMRIHGTASRRTQFVWTRPPHEKLHHTLLWEDGWSWVLWFFVSALLIHIYSTNERNIENTSIYKQSTCENSMLFHKWSVIIQISHMYRPLTNFKAHQKIPIEDHV